ncbi:MAG: 2,3,4,5-tetrahydropyridine-2,6-dicarboxylate N-succinyltransferase [Bacteriovorax sp.]|nr:2,3,4,5-tetrahydropyridine-2,6-dicarboxylate N-succinyltransferase [Bacteriovorax sp.]
MNIWEKTLNDLEAGRVRSANFIDGTWVANTEIKMQILEAFKAGVLVEENGFVDKHNLMPQSFNVERGIRIVPGGTSVRRGSYIAKGVIIMPPSYVNVGAFVDEGTMIDSHVLIGSCAQIGKKVHLSTAVQIGGVLEPIGAAPVIIEDEAFIGAGAIIVEGIQVKRRAVIAPGVILSKGIPVYDLVNNRILNKGEPIPENAIVVPGNRPVKADLTWGHELGLTLQCAIIVKYRDEKSEASLVLEDFLR